MNENPINPSGNTDQPVDNTKTMSNNEPIVTNTVPAAPESVTTAPESFTSESTPNPLIATPVSNTTNNENQPIQSKKKHTGLIIGIIIALLVLGGGGTFAAFAIIRNQPENVALESFSNLLSARQLVVSGELNLTPSEYLKDSIGPISLKINSKSSGMNQSSDSTLTIEMPNMNQSIGLDFSEVIMNNGVLYFKASGIQKVYDDILYGAADYYLNTPTAKKAIENIIKKVDNEWIEVSLDDILEHKLVKAYIDDNTKQAIIEGRDCSISIANKSSDYSSELSNLYSNNQFITLQSSQDSFYKLSIDADKLVSYLNTFPQTKLANDLASCGNTTINDEVFESITTKKISSVISEMPDVYAKFDGFLSHHLTALKINDNNEYFNISANLNFAYPSNITVTAPSESTPIMDLVEYIINETESNS